MFGVFCKYNVRSVDFFFLNKNKLKGKYVTITKSHAKKPNRREQGKFMDLEMSCHKMVKFFFWM